MLVITQSSEGVGGSVRSFGTVNVLTNDAFALILCDYGETFRKMSKISLGVHAYVFGNDLYIMYFRSESKTNDS